jgi:hypothetical protein
MSLYFFHELIKEHFHDSEVVFEFFHDFLSEGRADKELILFFCECLAVDFSFFESYIGLVSNHTLPLGEDQYKYFCLPQWDVEFFSCKQVMYFQR